MGVSRVLEVGYFGGFSLPVFGEGGGFHFGGGGAGFGQAQIGAGEDLYFGRH